jgi:hypothetical protein
MVAAPVCASTSTTACAIGIVELPTGTQPVTPISHTRRWFPAASTLSFNSALSIWVWLEEKMSALLDSDDGRSLFVAGWVSNQSKFYDQFDAVVLLSAPTDVILDRVARRTTNDYGKTALERAEILADLATVKPLLREGCTHELDASRPLADTIADLIAIASRPITTS